MFTAVGTGARHRDDGSIEVSVSLRREDNTELGRQSYVGPTLDDVCAQIGADLSTRAAAEKDAALNDAVVGKTLVTLDDAAAVPVVTTVASLPKLTTAIVTLLLVAFATVRAVGQPAAPTLTTLEKARADLLQVRTAYAQVLAQYDGCRAELGTVYNALGPFRAREASTTLSADEMALRVDIETAHPGYTWDPKTGTLTKKPDPPAAVKK